MRCRLAACVLGMVATLVAAAAWAQRTPEQEDLLRWVRVHVELSPDSLTVGDRVVARFTIRTDARSQVQFAPEPKLGDEVQLLGFEAMPAQTNPGVVDELTWEAEYSLAVYVVGERMLPPLRALVHRDSVSAEVRSDSLFVYVASVLDDSLAAGDLVDIKTQRDLAIPLPLWVWIVAAVVVVAALWLWLWWRRRTRRPIEVVVEPPKPAHQVALLALRQLQDARLPFDGRIKEHYVRLSEILRRYLEDAPPFGIRALEETTDEIVWSLRDKRVANERVIHVQLLCEESDLVKFAKHQPPVDECMRALERVADFVRETSKPVPQAMVPEGAVVEALRQATQASNGSRNDAPEDLP